MLLLSTAYFAPISYYSELLSNDSVVIEKFENYIRKSYRNRCTIYGANGLLNLVVPVVKSVETKIPITEIEISYDTPWQKLHFKSLEAAYRRSPYYEYYIDDLMIFFNERFKYLYQFNMLILKTVCYLLKIHFNVQESSSYVKNVGDGIIDLRYAIHPKIKQLHLQRYSYNQVFAEKWGFKPNLSILDLLFNTGPDAIKILLTVNH